MKIEYESFKEILKWLNMNEKVIGTMVIEEVSAKLTIYHLYFIITIVMNIMIMIQFVVVIIRAMKMEKKMRKKICSIIIVMIMMIVMNRLLMDCVENNKMIMLKIN